MVFDDRLDSMVSEVFSNLVDSVILRLVFKATVIFKSPTIFFAALLIKGAHVLRVPETCQQGAKPASSLQERSPAQVMLDQHTQLMCTAPDKAILESCPQCLFCKKRTSPL